MKSKQELTKLVDKVKELKGIIAIPLENWDKRTVNGMKAKQRLAETDIVSALQAYRTALLANTLGIVVIGTQSNLFAQIAQQEAGCYVVDANELYASLALRLDGLGKEYGPSHISRIVEELVDVGRTLSENGMLRGDSIPFPKDLNMASTIRNVTHLSELIRASIEAGHTEPSEHPNDLARAFLTNVALTLAIGDLYSREILPVVIIGTKQSQLRDLRGNLFEGRVFVVQAGTALFEAAPEAILDEKFGKKKVLTVLIDAKKATIPTGPLSDVVSTKEEEIVVEEAIAATEEILEATPTETTSVETDVVEAASTETTDEAVTTEITQETGEVDKTQE